MQQTTVGYCCYWWRSPRDSATAA